MSFEVRDTAIPGCRLIVPRVFEDRRGRFVKTFHEELFAGHGLETAGAEEFYSVSHKGVLRGLHFQLPPHDQVKLVYCVVGAVYDVVVDLRAGSPTYGEHAAFELSADEPAILYIPSGLAHGFCVRSEEAVVMYRVSRVYAPEHDTGILWSSAGIPWPADVPLVSARDQAFPTLAEFRTPFRYGEPQP
jgi:dTDP-4-dehydrorhamnose 3,5-epimerase